MPTTQENLAVAFAGESQLMRKYEAFASQADREGLPQIARLFRAAMRAEHVHAMGHLANADGVGTTLSNLRASVDVEIFNFDRLYPPMVAQAKKEEHKGKKLLQWAMGAEQGHAELFQQALVAIASGTDLAAADVWVCPYCGDVEIGERPDTCPVCSADGSLYEKVA